MTKSKKRKLQDIHPSVKIRLGYDATEPDEDVYSDWKERTSRVCKPCWELKYCPYGPLVEHSPLLPPLRGGLEEQQEYFRRCLETNTVGEVTALTDHDRQMYESWLADEQILLQQGFHKFTQAKRLASAALLDSEDSQIEAWIGGDLPPIHIYRAPYSERQSELVADDFEPEVWREIERLAEAQRRHLEEALASGKVDNTGPLEPVRRLWFERRVAEFVSDEYPEDIPSTFTEASCTIFGHICPVFFAAEEMTETQEERRIGRRHLTFKTMMRIVRRDDYRCQHCFEKLQDNEVEFDHIIPVSKGGSSEEHNLRLTCFDCNRDKSDDYTP